jgi:hypothetical protein
MTILNLHKALELYDTLLPYLPEMYNVDIYDFVRGIISNIVKADKHFDFIKAMSIVLNKSTAEILSMNRKEVTQMFIDGLIENDIVYLIEFCRSLNYG